MMPDGGDGCDLLRQVTLERDCYRAVLEGAQYNNIPDIPAYGVEGCRTLGAEVARMTREAINAQRFLQHLASAQQNRGLITAVALLKAFLAHKDYGGEGLDNLAVEVKTFLKETDKLH